MESLKLFLQSPNVMALLLALFIFAITIFLVVRKSISFGITFLLLLFCIFAGVAISNSHYAVID
jgi:UPF0716 family protein affecting phage T7 exclusion